MCVGRVCVYVCTYLDSYVGFQLVMGFVLLLSCLISFKYFSSQCRYKDKGIHHSKFKTN